MIRLDLNSLLEFFDNKIDLLKLPGVGEYIASAFRSFHFGKREFIIDSNVVRLYGRFYGWRNTG